MSGRRVAFALSCVGAAAACANILGIDDGIPRDASVDVGMQDASDGDADAAVDAPPEAPFSPFACGTLTCNFALGETCCEKGDATFDCVDGSAACKGAGSLYIPCDGPEQCVGDAGAKECCTTDVLTDAGTYVATSVSCLTAAQCTPIPTHYVLCGGDSGADCSDATMCEISVTTLPGFLICK
jgi:hypothetical protein